MVFQHGKSYYISLCFIIICIFRAIFAKDITFLCFCVSMCCFIIFFNFKQVLGRGSLPVLCSSIPFVLITPYYFELSSTLMYTALNIYYSLHWAVPNSLILIVQSYFNLPRKDVDFFPSCVVSLEKSTLDIRQVYFCWP